MVYDMADIFKPGGNLDFGGSWNNFFGKITDGIGDLFSSIFFKDDAKQNQQDINNAYSFAAMDYANQIDQSNADKANKVADEKAALAYERQKELQQMVMDFNSSEAEKARAYDEKMSSTAYQRAVADMKAAGINPILAFSNGGASYSGGSAASVGVSTASQAQGYMASTHEQDIDQTSATELKKVKMQILGQLLSTSINSASRVQSSIINAIKPLGE